MNSFTFKIKEKFPFNDKFERKVIDSRTFENANVENKFQLNEKS